MRSAKCRWPTQAKLLRILEDSQSAAAGRQEPNSKWMCAWWRPPTKCPTKPSAAAICARTCSTASTFSTSTCRRCASARRIFRRIAEALIADLNRKHECRVTDISPAVLEAFERHDWPGNVRELRNVLERAVILAGEGAIEMKHLPAFLQTAAPPWPPAAGASLRAACRGRRVGPFQHRHHRGGSRERAHPADPRTHPQQQDARRRDPGNQPENAAQ